MACATTPLLQGRQPTRYLALRHSEAFVSMILDEEPARKHRQTMIMPPWTAVGGWWRISVYGAF
jgi:hypothetical protein